MSSSMCGCLAFLACFWLRSVSLPTHAFQVYIKRNHAIAGACLDPHWTCHQAFDNLEISSYPLSIVSANKRPLPKYMVLYLYPELPLRPFHTLWAFMRISVCLLKPRVHVLLISMIWISCSNSSHQYRNVIWFAVWRLARTWRVSSTYLGSSTPIWGLLTPPLNVVLQDMGVNNLMEDLFHGSKQVPQIGRAYFQQSIALVSICRQIVPHVGLYPERNTQLEG